MYEPTKSMGKDTIASDDDDDDDDAADDDDENIDDRIPCLFLCFILFKFVMKRFPDHFIGAG